MAYRNLKMKDKPKYKKKIDPAFPKRSNSAQTMQTLQASNRSLAQSLEKMRHEFLRAYTDLTKLKIKNNKLKEQVCELKQQEKPFLLSEKEVDKRYKEKLRNVRKKIFILNDLATEFVDILTELSEICFSGTFPETVSLSVLASPCSSPMISRKTQFLERSSNKQEPFSCASDENNSLYRDQLSDSSKSDSIASLLLKRHYTQSNMPRHSRELNKPCYSSRGKALSNFNQISSDSVQNGQSQETFIIPSIGFSKSNISNFTKQQFKLGHHPDENNEWIDTDTQALHQDSGDLGFLPASSVRNKHKNGLGSKRKCESKLWSSSSLDQLSVLTFEMPSELSKPPKTSNKIAKQKKRRSSPLRKPCTHKKDSGNLVKADHFTVNEIDLINAYEQSLERSVSNASYITTLQHYFPHKIGKQSLLPKNGKEYLIDEKNYVAEYDGLSNEAWPVGSTNNRDNVTKDLFKSCNVRKNKQKESSVGEIEGKRFLDQMAQVSNLEQFLYECKTLIESTDDCNFGPFNCRKTKLKQKKEKAGKRISPLRRNLQPGSDFKDKSHVFNAKRQKVKSLIDLSTDPFSLSPPMYLRKQRPRSKSTKSTTKQHSSAEVGHKNNSSIKQIPHVSLSEDSKQEILFQGYSPATDLNYQTSPHYERQNQCESNKRSIRKRILSKFNWIQSKTSAASIKIEGLLKPVDDSLELTESAIETTALCKKLVDSQELLNKDASNMGFITDDNLNTHTPFKMSSLNFFESGANFKPRTTKNNLVPVEDSTVSPSMLSFQTEARIHSHRIEREQDTICVALSVCDINAKTCGLLPHYFPAVEVDKLDGERDTNECLASHNSNVRNFTKKKEFQRLLNNIKHMYSSNARSQLDSDMGISEETSNKENECTETVFLACSVSDDEFEAMNTFVESIKIEQ